MNPESRDSGPGPSDHPGMTGTNEDRTFPLSRRRLGSCLCCGVSDFERIILRQCPQRFPDGGPRRHCAGLGCEILIAGGLPPATAMHKSSLPAISTESTHEHADETLRVLQAWPDHAA